ncbi:hypothetical protein D3C85_1129620 [compost metagenome]
MEPLRARPEAGQFQLRMQALAAGFGKQGVGKVQGGVDRAADQAFMAVDAAVGQVDDGLEARSQELFAQNSREAGVRGRPIQRREWRAGRDRPWQSVK